jgi:hypothetical protein
MKIEKILKKLTPERIKKEVEAVNAVKLPPELQKWVKEYEKVGERDEYIWKWFLKIEKEINSPFIIETHQKSLQEVRFLMAMFVILLDDVADQQQNSRLLNELLKIPFNQNYTKFNKLNQKEKEYLDFAIKVWLWINFLIKDYQRYKKFKNLFKYDIKQIFNAIKYDYLINKNRYLINKTEFWLYSPHTMQILTTATLNLMCTSMFDIRELGIIREVFLEAQKMARIGNWISTWEREINENDFTSGIFAYAVSSNIITVQELLNTNSSEIIRKIKRAEIENKLLREWDNCYRTVFRFEEKIKTINIQKLLNGLEKLLILEIISRKHK